MLLHRYYYFPLSLLPCRRYRAVIACWT